jgi:hypothetical protein
MPQHDLILDNGSGAAFRADANNALAALGSSMKGPNAPPAPIAGMMWLDDDTPSASLWTLKMYDGAEWIEIGRLNVTTNVFTVAEGSFAPVDIASAATTDIGAAASLNVRITGTTGITSFGTVAAGTRRFLAFAAALTLTHNATSLILPGVANITTAAGDTAVARSLGSGNWVIESFTRASGAVIVPLGSAAAPAVSFSGDTDTGALSPGANRIQFATNGVARQEIAADGSQLSVIPGGSALLPDFKCRAWVNFNGQGTVAIRASGNVSSITDHGTGDYTINFTTAMPDADYAPFVSAGFASYISFINLNAVGAEIAPTTSGFRFVTNNASNSLQIDQKYVHVSIFR